MSTTGWLKTVLKTRPDLFRAIYDWNVYPHRWALPAWLEPLALSAALIALLENSRRGRRRLSVHFRDALGLHQDIWDLEEPRRRLALLPSATLERLACFTGAAVHAGRLARVVTKTDRRAVTDRIGQDAYDFALRRRGLTAAPEIPPPSGQGELADIIRHAGWRTLASVFGDEPVALRQRFRLKVPPAIDLSSTFAGDASSVEAWEFLQPITRVICSREELQCLA